MMHTPRLMDQTDVDVFEELSKPEWFSVLKKYKVLPTLSMFYMRIEQIHTDIDSVTATHLQHMDYSSPYCVLMAHMDVL